MNDRPKITRDIFVAAVGREPMNDELKRANCEHVGEVGHEACGWRWYNNLPRFLCGCRVQKRAGSNKGDNE